MSLPYVVRCGDSLRLLAELERDSVDAVITDCPYSSGGMVRGDRTMRAHTKYVRSDAANQSLGAFEGDSRDQRGWAFWCSLWYGECWRVTRPGGFVLSFTDWRQLPSTTDAMQAGGWVWRGLAPWNKGEGSRPQRGRFRAQCEYLVLGTKGPQELCWDAPCLPGFFTGAPPPAAERFHITQKPVGVMLDLVRLVPPGGVVLDPFGGSGTTAVAALRLGRRAIVFELVPENAALIVERLEAELEQLDLEAARAGQAGLFAAADSAPGEGGQSDPPRKRCEAAGQGEGVVPGSSEEGAAGRC